MLGTSCADETQVFKFSIQPNHIFKRNNFFHIMTTIKNFIALFLLVVIATVFNTSNASAQAGGKSQNRIFHPG